MMISHHFLTVCCSVYLNTVQLQFNSHTKTLDSVNFASNSFLQSSSISNKSLLMSILKTSMNKLFQLKYILLMIFPAFVRSGNCDKSQKLISYLLTNFCNPTSQIKLRSMCACAQHSCLPKFTDKALLCFSSNLVETRRVELLTSCVQSRRSTN